MREAELKTMRDGDYAYVITYNGYAHTLVAGRCYDGQVQIGPDDYVSARSAYKSLGDAIDAFRNKCPREYSPTDLKIDMDNPRLDDFKNVCSHFQKGFDLLRRQLGGGGYLLDVYRKANETIRGLRHGIELVSRKLEGKLRDEWLTYSRYEEERIAHEKKEAEKKAKRKANKRRTHER